jgi:hypothetical protein
MDAQIVIDRFVTYARDGKLDDNPMLSRLVGFYLWLVEARLCFIRDTSARIVPLIPNRTQRKIVAAMMVQAACVQPIRLQILKARKRGVTTLVQALFFYLCKDQRNQVAACLAHITKSTDEIFEIARLMATHYPGAVDRQRQIRFDTRSRYWCSTAGSESVGAGGTPNLLHLSEVALWKRNKEETHYASTEAVPGTPESVIVEESTARGRELFYNNWERGLDPASGYASLFIPWYLDEDLRVVPVVPVEPDEDERALVDRAEREYGIQLDDHALEWRRRKIADKGIATFRQEYPSTPEEAVQGSQDLILPGMRDCVIDQLPFNVYKLSPDTFVGGGDFGWNDPTVLITAYMVDQVVYVVGVYRATATLARAHVVGLKQSHTYYCDPAALDARKELEAACRDTQLVCRLIPAPRRKASDRDMNFVNGEWEKVRKLMATGKLKVLDECADQLIYESDNLSWNSRTGLPDMVRDPQGADGWGHFDTLDALRYLVLGVMPTVELQPMFERRERRHLSRREAMTLV